MLSFSLYLQDGSGSVLRDDLNKVFIELFPGLNRCAAVLCVCVFCVFCVSCVTVVVVCRTMLEAFVTDELRAADRTFSRSKIT